MSTIKALLRRLKLSIFPRYRIILPTYKGEIDQSQKLLNGSQVYNIILRQMDDFKNHKIYMKYNIYLKDVVDAAVECGLLQEVKRPTISNTTYYYLSPGFIQSLNTYRVERVKG